MSNLKKCLSAAQTLSKFVQIRGISQSFRTRTLAVSEQESPAKATSPKIEEIANNIAQLSLIEVIELTDVLKKKLNLPDTPLNFGVAQAAGSGDVAAAAAENVESVPEEETKTSFTVKIKKYDEKQKVALIKEVKSLLDGMNLVQAKKFVESTPVIVKTNIGKDEAEKMKEVLTKVGADVEIM